MQNTVESGAKEIVFALLKKIHWIILSAIMGVTAVFCVTRFVIPPQYTSSISLYVNNVIQNNQAMQPTLDLNSIYASQHLVNTYIVILRDDEVLDQVANTLMQEYSDDWLQEILPYSQSESGYALSAATLRSVIRMSAVNNTEVLGIDAETKDAEVSARICSLIAEMAPDVLSRVVKAGSVEVIGEAKVSYRPSSPRLLVNCAVGLLAGAGLSALWFLLRLYLNVKIKGAEDLKKRFDIPVLGVIPDVNTVHGGILKRR